VGGGFHNSTEAPADDDGPVFGDQAADSGGEIPGRGIRLRSADHADPQFVSDFAHDGLSFLYHTPAVFASGGSSESGFVLNSPAEMLYNTL